MLVEKIKNRESGIVLYGLVPPKKGTDSDKINDIATLQMQRLQQQNIDGLVLYDIQDEATRTSEERPFPFIETLDPFNYAREQLAALTLPKIIYRSVGKYQRQQLTDFLSAINPEQELAVFVGASSAAQAVTMSISDAYALRNATRQDVILGGVAIPERHHAKGNEHLKVFGKIAQGCSFFVSQAVYDVNASKDFLSDYYYYGQQHGIPLVPIIFTLTPCGSQKTLEFMKWLGISIPRWLENDLIHAENILQHSVQHCAQVWQELREFADEKGIPIGCNIESVAIRKVEVEASVELLQRVIC